MGRIRSTDYEDIRDRILDRTAAVFARQGFAATSISDIADACACSRSRLYHYFDSKEALLREMLATHVDTLLQRCRAVSSGDGDPKEKFLRLVRLFMEVYAVSRDRHVVMLTCLDALSDQHREEIVEKQRELVAFVSDALGDIRPDRVDDDYSRIDTMLFFGMINWTYTWYSADGPVSPDDLARRAGALFLDGYV